MKNLRHSRAQKRIILVLVVVIVAAGLFAVSKHLYSKPPFRLLLGAYDFFCTYYIETLDVVIDVSPAEQTIDCITTLKIRPENNSRGYLTFVLADNFAIESALLNGIPAKVWRLWLLNIIRIPKNQRHQPLELCLTYRGQPQSTFLSIDPGFISEKGAALLTNDLWLPHMTRQAPGEVDSTYTIKVPQGYQIATAGRPEKPSAEAGKTAQKWEKTNLASILIERFTVTGHAGSKDFRIFTPPQYAHLGKEIALLADEIVQNYELRLGAIEPRNINIAFSQGTFSGFYIGGLIAIPINRLERFAAVIDRPGSSAYEDFYHLLAHELAHMWWQNAGDNISEFMGIQWFSEGITEFASLWLTGEKLGRHVYMERLNRGVDRIKREQNVRALDQYAYWEHSPIPYYKGAMMLESLRLQEGIGPVFEFLAHMSKLPKGPKTPEMAAELALQVFGRDCTAFFQHWISGAEPFALRVADHNIEDKKMQLTVVSCQASELPLEIAVVYKEEIDLKHFPLKKGENKYTLSLKPGAVEIIIDPHRRLFRLAPFDSRLSIIIEQQRQTPETARKAVAGKDYIVYDAFTPVEEFFGLCKGWVPIGKQMQYGDYTARLDYFLPGQRGPWGLITVKWEETPAYYLDAILWGRMQEHMKVRGQIRASSIDFENLESKFLVKWERYVLRDESMQESNWRLSFAYDAEDYLAFSAGPIEPAVPPLQFIHGGRVETEEFQVEVDELSFDVLDSTLKISLKGKKGWLPVELLSYDLLLSDGTLIPSAAQARFQSAGETEYEIALPLIASTPIPLRVDITGLAFKKADSPLLYYHPGGTLYIGLSQSEAEWEQASLNTIRLGANTAHLEFFDPHGNAGVSPVLRAGNGSLEAFMKATNREKQSQRTRICLLQGNGRHHAFGGTDQDGAIPVLEAVLEPGGEISTSLDVSTPLPVGWYSIIASTEASTDTLGRFFLFKEEEFTAAEQRARKWLEEWLVLLPKDRPRAEQQLLDLGWEMPFWFDSLPPLEQANAIITDVTYAQAGLDPKPSFVYSLIFKTKEQGNYYCTLAVPSDHSLQ